MFEKEAKVQSSDTIRQRKKMTKNKLKPIDVSKYTVTDTGQVLKMNKEVEVIQRPTYAELEEKISILLSCKNCPNNKGGYICQKEYEDKCLSQKTQYIKELQEEIAELNSKLSNLSRVAEVIELDTPESVVLDKLDEAKEIIKLLLGDLRNRSYEPVKDLERAEQFLKENK